MSDKRNTSALLEVLQKMPEEQFTEQVILPYIRALYPEDRIEERQG